MGGLLSPSSEGSSSHGLISFVSSMLMSIAFIGGFPSIGGSMDYHVIDGVASGVGNGGGKVVLH
jgi:hypothetical protein